MRTVLYHGKIYLKENQFAQALLVEDGIILKTGTDEEVLLEAEGATLLDCKGRTVLPGFNDSHMHLHHLAMGYAQVKLNDVTSLAMLIAHCKDFLQQHPKLVTNGLLGRGWNEDLFTDEVRQPNRYDLDQISTTIPVVLQRVCGHIVSANSKALELLGLLAEIPTIDGGVIYTNHQGNPTGIFAETACELPCSLIPMPDMKSQKKLMLQAMDYAVSVGLTSVQSNDINDFEGEKELRKMIESLYREGIAPLRYRFQCCFRDFASFERVLQQKAYRLTLWDDPWLTLGPLKLYKDGSLGGRTAYLKQPYADDPGNCGVEVLSDTEMERYLALAKTNRIQVVTHVIGDAAADHTADCYIRFMDNNNRLRHGLIHLQITDLPLLQKIAKHRILAFYQPVFLEYDLHIADQRVGKELARTSYAFQTMETLGGKVSYGTDCPVEDCNPFYNLHCAINRTDLNNEPRNGYNPQEKVSVATAIDAYTWGSAYAEFKENEKGRLWPNYVADLVILDQDIFTIDPLRIKEIKPVVTMTDGYVVYRNIEEE